MLSEFLQGTIKPSRVLFICKGSTRDGLGHISRTRAVALEASLSEEVQVLVIGDMALSPLISHYGLDVHFVKSDDLVLPFVNHFKPEILIFDLLHLDDKVFQELQAVGLLISLSPIFNQLAAMDLFFHRTKVLAPALKTSLQNTRVFSGFEYAVISEQITRIPTEIYNKVLNQGPLSIAISMGGADAANKTLKILQTVRQINEPMIFWVLLGEGYAHSYQELVDEMQGSRHEIILAKTNASMWHVLSMCSLGIFAGGVTTYEAAYAGLPALILLENLNNRFLVAELAERKMGIIADQPFPGVLNQLNDKLSSLSLERSQLLAMHQASDGCLDYLGASRIINKILELKHLNQSNSELAG